MERIDVTKLKAVHFVGIKGVAMTALAIVAYEMGIRVSGSDTDETFPTSQTLEQFRIEPLKGFSKKNVPHDASLVIYTGAHEGAQNSEVAEAKRLRIATVSHGEALGLFMWSKSGISVAGSHGKTTTSAIVAHILTTLGEDPSYAIGCGSIISLRTSGHFGYGRFFVAEADEYATDPNNDPTPRFMWQNPKLLIITNIDFDHPDVYGNLEAVKQAFVGFVNKLDVKAKVVVNRDDKATFSVVPLLKRRVITYGFDAQANYRIGNVHITDHQQEFEVFKHKKRVGHFSIQIPGTHNVANATAAIVALFELGFDPKKIRAGLTTFSGTKRRFEYIGTKNHILLYDDYAHHPAEIRATLLGAKDWYPDKRLVVVFQPHTYSRTLALLNQFTACFTSADRVLITDIYASARESEVHGVSGKLLVDEIRKQHKDVLFTPKKADVLKYLRNSARPNDLIVTMGAGDIYNWLTEILSCL